MTLCALWLWGNSSAAAPAPAPASGPDGAPSSSQRAEIDWQTYVQLRGGLEPVESEAAAPHAAFRAVTLRPVPDGEPPGVAVDAVWTLRADRSGFVAGLLAGPAVEIERATINGSPAPIARTPAGTVLAVYLRRDATLRVSAFMPAAIAETGGDFSLSLLPAVRGSVELAPTPARPLTLQPQRVPDTGGMFLRTGVLWSGAAELALRVHEPSTIDKDKGPLAIAHVGMGITIGEGELTVRAKVVWSVRRGSLKTLSMRVRGPSGDLEVTGPGVSSWSRSGDTITVQLAAAVSSQAQVDLHWTEPLRDTTEARFDIPRIEPNNAFRSDSSLQLARDGEIEVIPTMDSWGPVATDELPRWGRGLVEGTPTAAFQRAKTSGDAGSLSLLRFVPVPGPAAVVDVAEYTLALTDEGRLLGRAKYQVRNERAAFLRVAPPPGVTIIGATIAGETALPARAPDGAWLIPLQRSLETVEGLLSFPVEVTLLGEGEHWERRERRQITLPTLDAPVAVARATVYLPPRYASKLKAGDGAVVDAFTRGEGITYGLGLGDEENANAEALFQGAVEDYRNNDFKNAQAKLEALEASGASNDNVARLQSNVDLVTGNAGDEQTKGDRTKETALSRRVRDQAKARAGKDFASQIALEEKAEALYRAGDYQRAEASYEAALDLGDKLENLEQSESVETDRRNKALAGKLGKLQRERKGKSKRAAKVANVSAFETRRGPRKKHQRRNSEVAAGEGRPGTGERAFHTDDDDDDTGTMGGDARASTPGAYANTSSDLPATDAAVTAGQQRPDASRDTKLGRDAAPRPATVANGSGHSVEVEDQDIPVQDAPEPEPEPVESTLAPSPAGVSFAGRTSTYRVFGSNTARGARRGNRRSRRSASFSSGRRRGKRQASTAMHKPAPSRAAPSQQPSAPPPPADATPASATDSYAPLETSAPAGSAPPQAVLPTPVVTASALSVVVPAVGESVLYQTLLIEANHAHTLSIDARRRRPRRRTR